MSLLAQSNAQRAYRIFNHAKASFQLSIGVTNWSKRAASAQARSLYAPAVSNTTNSTTRSLIGRLERSSDGHSAVYIGSTGASAHWDQRRQINFDMCRSRTSFNQKKGVCVRRGLHSSSAQHHGGIKRPEPGTGIKVHFRDAKGNLLKTVEGNEGDSLLDLAQEYDIDMEGACEGSVACSTCHVILSPEHYDLLEEPEDDENDMLDMAFGLTDTSRLGCQVLLKKELDGMTATLPAATRNFFVDGAKPTKH
ncbi:probable YAH1-Ferredoxin of the mitochondrial matrix [Serendipita indica DSM 11827]|uniref:Probable YAH1-Ferredoxin of the mitochondrial matrix n=1 Tax=Serendipita indica (strain DSM 11827) TaxID=1109443 RepID=G4TUY0_SERID|nr:probable YAH1-Ferredoxin of the mitochondrial matrix [Serendipita indica DSM 11827]